MAQKNDTTALILAFLITAGLIGGGIWWFTRHSGTDLSRLLPGASPAPGGTGASGSGASSTTAPGTSTSPSDSFASVQNVPSGLFGYGGSTSWAPIRLTVDPAIQSARPEFRLRYTNPIGSAPGSGTGIRMLLDGELALAQSSRPLSQTEYQQADQRGFKLKQIPVAIDGLAVAVNPSLKLTGLTLDQLRAIYSGQVTNWQQVGGPNLAIQPLTRPVTAGGTIELFVEEILQGKQFGPNVQTVNTTTDALRQLTADPGGIYFASAPEVVPQCKIVAVPLARQGTEFVPPYQQPPVPVEQCPGQRNKLNSAAFQNGTYPLTRNLYVIVKQNGGTEEQAGNAYANLLLTGQGQALIEKAGFVRIR